MKGQLTFLQNLCIFSSTSVLFGSPPDMAVSELNVADGWGQRCEDRKGTQTKNGMCLFLVTSDTHALMQSCFHPFRDLYIDSHYFTKDIIYSTLYVYSWVIILSDSCQKKYLCHILFKHTDLPLSVWCDRWQMAPHNGS